MSHNRATTRPHILGALLAVFALTVGLLIGPLSLPAHAEGTVSTFDIDASLSPDGGLKVSQTLTFSGSAPAEVSQRFETRENVLGDREYVRQLKDITATVGGAAVTPTVTKEGRYTTVTINTSGAAGPIVMNYVVFGASVQTETGTALRWRLLQGLSAEVTEFNAVVQIPTMFSYVNCTAGSPNSSVPCGSVAGGTDDAQSPTFRDGPRGEGEVVGIDIGFPPGAIAVNESIEYRWTVARAFSAKPLPLALALGLLALGGLALYSLHRRSGADKKSDGAIAKAGEFAPVAAGASEFRVVSDIRPGHIGTVVDERVDPIDVTASLLDLAVRGHLLITQLPLSSEFGRADWSLTRLGGGSTDELRPFEKALLDGIAPVGGSVKVSELAGRVQESIGGVQSALYDEMVSNGWYEQRPDATRNKWTRLSLIALVLGVVATIALAAFTTFGLVGLALVILGLGFVFVAQDMPSRTPKGAALLAGLGALRSDLLNHPTDQMPPGQELRELSEVLPYAVVLGGADRWLDAIVATDSDKASDGADLTWYHAPDNWHLSDLPASLRNFITTVSGSLFSR